MLTWLKRCRFHRSGSVVMWHPRQPSVERAVEWFAGITHWCNFAHKNNIFITIMTISRQHRVKRLPVPGAYRQVKNLHARLGTTKPKRRRLTVSLICSCTCRADKKGLPRRARGCQTQPAAPKMSGSSCGRPAIVKCYSSQEEAVNMALYV